MPPFTSSFWKVYGNKLRVFGTEERHIDLSKHGLTEEETMRVRELRGQKQLSKRRANKR